MKTIMEEHSPAPWKSVPSTTDGYLYIRDATGKIILCPTTDEDISCRPVDMALILAAPDLLERLSVLVAAVERGEVLVHHIRSARAAIARAEGR